ncbi:MAG: hypothetical protein ACERKO_04060 [Acetanaerobacterium sp.]
MVIIMNEIAKETLPYSQVTKAQRKQHRLERKQQKTVIKLEQMQHKRKLRQDKQRRKAQKKLERAENRWQLAAFKQDIKEIFKRRKQQGK